MKETQVNEELNFLGQGIYVTRSTFIKRQWNDFRIPGVLFYNTLLPFFLSPFLAIPLSTPFLSLPYNSE